MKEYIVKVCLIFVLSITGLLILLPAIGLASWVDIKDIFQSWYGILTFIIGGLFGHYFPNAGTRSTTSQWRDSRWGIRSFS